MKLLRSLIRNRDATAAAEMALVTPLLLTLMLGCVELGNLFLDQHALTTQVRDGARFASRLELSGSFACPGSVFAATDATDQIAHVTKYGSVSGSGNPRWNASYWARNCDDGAPTLAVSFRCVPKADVDAAATGNAGIYTSLSGDIPVVTVAGAVKYRSVLNTLGWTATDICLRSQSEAAVQGL